MLAAVDRMCGNIAASGFRKDERSLAVCKWETRTYPVRENELIARSAGVMFPLYIIGTTITNVYRETRPTTLLLLLLIVSCFECLL